MVNATFEINQKPVPQKSGAGPMDPEELLSNLGQFVFKVEGECDAIFAKKLARLLKTEGVRQKKADKKADQQVER